MKTIWKFPLEITDEQRIFIPEGAQLLTVQLQGATPCIWAMVDPKARRERRYIRTIGTGHPMDEEDSALAYLGTYQVSELVFHVFYGANP